MGLLCCLVASGNIYSVISIRVMIVEAVTGIGQLRVLRMLFWCALVTCMWQQSEEFDTLDARNPVLVRMCEMHVTTVTGI